MINQRKDLLEKDEDQPPLTNKDVSIKLEVPERETPLVCEL